MVNAVIAVGCVFVSALLINSLELTEVTVWASSFSLGFVAGFTARAAK